jgi:hypothetical protein
MLHQLKEINMRMLIRLYNGQRYVSALLPVMDDMTGPGSTIFYKANNTTKMPDYKLSDPILVNDIELDNKFKAGYQDWLEKEVYTTDDDDDDDDDDETDDWQLGTPIPDALPAPISAEDLTREINKLYQEELQREFHEKMIIKKQKHEQAQGMNGWGDPAPVVNGWGDGAETSAWEDDVATTTTSSSSSSASDFDWSKQQQQQQPHQGNLSDDEDADEVEPEVDPLQGINWETLSEDDLMKRLAVVEEKTSRRWLNVDMDDPRYLKVLNTFEGETIEDDEGWTIEYI